MIDKTFWIVSALLLFFALAHFLLTLFILHKGSKESKLEPTERFKPSIGVAIEYVDRLVEQRTAVSEWLASLSLVLITIAVPIMLTKVQGLSKTEKNVFFFMVMNGLLFSFGSLTCGLLYKRYLLQSCRQNPHVHFIKEENEVGYEVFRPVEKRYDKTRTKLELLLYIQPQFFIEGVLLLVAASLLYAAHLAK